MAVLNEQEAVTITDSKIEIVNNDDDAKLVLIGNIMDFSHYLVLIFQIELAGRFEQRHLESTAYSTKDADCRSLQIIAKHNAQVILQAFPLVFLLLSHQSPKSF